jgi:transposase
MGNPAGVKRDFEALEKRRLEAVRLSLKNDLQQTEVARRLHVSRQTLSRWLKEFRAGGKTALKKADRAGRKPELTEEDRIRLADLLRNAPEQLGYETSVWTCASVAELIAEQFGIEYHPGHVWKILDQLGWSRQRQELVDRRPSARPDRVIVPKGSKSSRASDDPSSVVRRILERMARRYREPYVIDIISRLKPCGEDPGRDK